MSCLRIRFPKPGFFLNDARVVIEVDGVVAYDGSFREGFDVTATVEPGTRRIESVIDIGIAKRRRGWTVTVPESGCVVEVAYSRVWGNFARKLAGTDGD